MSPKVLLLGIGNPARQDDGLGPAIAEEVERWGLAGVSVDADYQLTVEDAAAAAEHEVLLIADAAAAGPEPFAFTRLKKSEHLEFSSHSVEPGGVLGLCERAFGKLPDAFVLAVRGYEFAELTEGLTPRARENMEAALGFLQPLLREGGFARAAGEEPPPRPLAGVPLP